MKHSDRFYMLVRLWVRKSITNGDFIDMAGWVERKDEAIHLVFRQMTAREFNRTIAAAFLAAARVQTR